MPDIDIPAANDRRYRQAMRSVAAGIAIIDLRGRWVDVNPALARLLGHDDGDDLRGQRVADSFHPDDVERAHAHLTALATSADDRTGLPQRYRDRTGRLFHAQAEVAVLRDDDAAPYAMVMHLRDPITHDPDRMQLQRALAESEQARQALSRQQDILAHGISHDLRAPLRAIESFSALLESDGAAALDDSGRDYLQHIRAATARMGELIDELLDLARVERAELAPETVDISMLADWAAAELQDADPGRSARITVAPGLRAYGNERLLRMLMQQLLDNAWRFSRDRDQVLIRIDGESIDDKLQVAVRDQGSGFDMRYADKILEPFQRLHAPEHGGGHGIGLAIAKRIVERHGGWLRAQSQPGVGSVFTFSLPAASAGATTSEQAA